MDRERRNEPGAAGRAAAAWRARRPRGSGRNCSTGRARFFFLFRLINAACSLSALRLGDASPAALSALGCPFVARCRCPLPVANGCALTWVDTRGLGVGWAALPWHGS